MLLGPAPAPRYSLAMEFVLFSVWALYFLPFAVSAGNEHEHHVAILIFSACAGWTGVGWVVALIWALHPSPQLAPSGNRGRVIPLHPAPSQSG